MFRKDIRKKILLSASFLLAILLTSSVLAADVAYIYKNNQKIDQNVLSVFREMNLSVELINEKNLPKDFSKYKFIFVGNEKFSNAKKIPVGTAPTVLMNGYYGKLYGLTDRDGVSKLSSSVPLSVIYEGKETQVYESVHTPGSAPLSYYFLSKNNRAGSLVEMASVKKNSRNRLGDVVSCASSGTTLENDKTANKNICFFGIVASDYWTAAAEEMFKECVGFVLSSSEKTCKTNADCDDKNPSTIDLCLYAGTSSARCQHTAVAANCEEDSDCGNDSFVGESSCSGNNLTKNFRTYTCNNPGTTQSSCSYSDKPKTMETCESGCSAGTCVGSSDLVHNIALVNVTNAVGKIRIQTADGEDILSGDNLQCNEKYKILVRVKNIGNYSENITFNGHIGSLEVKHSDVESLEAGKTSDRSKTINLTIAEGAYNLSIESIINGSADASPSDNKAQMEVHVSCGESEEVTACSSDDDCGTDGFVGENFCANDNVEKKYKIFTCNDPGTSQSVCSSNEEDRIVETCSSGCANNACIGSSSLIHDIALVNVTNAIGQIRIKTANGTDVLAGESLQCNQKYQITVRTKNLGNYTENVTFIGSLGSLNLTPGSISALQSSKTSDRTKTLNITLPSGTYNINIETILADFTDANPLNNIAKKQVTVAC